MSNKTLILSALVAIALVGITPGCATKPAYSTASLLASSGFKVIPATTPDQQRQMKTLPSGKVSKVVRNGTTYYVYPDHTQNVLYVGKKEQYQTFQNDLDGLQLAAEDAKAARESRGEALVNQEADVASGYDTPGWGTGMGWGTWGGFW